MNDSLEEMLPLTPAAFGIALVLARGAQHGYAIMQELPAVGLSLGPGTLYRSLQRMRMDGLLSELHETSGEQDARRRIYQLTPRGRAVAQAEAQRLSALVSAAAERGLLAVPSATEQRRA